MKKIILCIFALILMAAGSFLLFHRNSILSMENTVEMTDSTNTIVRVPKQPKRVIFLNTSNLEIFTSVGGKPIARTTSDNIPEDLKPMLKDVENIGAIYAPNLEKMLSLKPDLVIGTNVPFNIALRKPLEIANVPVYINVINSYEDVLQSIELMGKFANQPEKAAIKKAEISKEYNELTTEVKPNSGKRCLILFGNTESFSIATSKSFTGDLLNRLGGINIADKADKTKDSGYIPLSMEFINKQNPEVIMLITMSKGDIKETAAQSIHTMQTNPVWKDIKAVQTGQIYALPGALFTVNPGTHIIEAMKLMQRHMNGEK